MYQTILLHEYVSTFVLVSVPKPSQINRLHNYLEKTLYVSAVSFPVRFREDKDQIKLLKDYEDILTYMFKPWL